MVKIPFKLPGFWTLLTLQLSRNGFDRLELGLDAFIRLRLCLDLCKVPISVHALLLVKNWLFVGSQNAFNIPIYTYIIFTYYNLLFIYIYICVITYMICRYIRDSTAKSPMITLDVYSWKELKAFYLYPMFCWLEEYASSRFVKLGTVPPQNDVAV